MIKNFIKKIKEHRLFPLIAFIVFMGVCCVQYMAVEISAQNLMPILRIKLIYKLVGIGTILFINIFVLLVLKSVRTTLNITNILTFILAIVNHYVYKLHGTPFNIDLFKNAATAMNVIDGYTFEITLPVIMIIGAALAQLIVINILFGKVNCSRKHSAVYTVLLAGFMVVSYFTGTPVVNKSIVGWSWKEAISIVGYVPCIVQSTQQSLNAVQQPERYDEQAVKAAAEHAWNEEGRTATPDIILILNETLYDLNVIADTGVDCFEYIDSLENSISGYAVCPAIGGGTNKSEYELLTSNTLTLAPNVTPFNTLDMENASSAASYFKSLGYTTLATHPAEPRNYNRDNTYPKIGFDNSYFADSYMDVEFYGDRYFETDKSVYKNALKMYEEMGDAPRFLYLLTIQNHGGYTLNSANMATVKTDVDFGEYTHNVNEFLSCMQLSDMAFEDIVNYFDKSERDVIVCMVGDHAPDFASNIVSPEYSDEEKNLLLRSVPYVIWSNNLDLSGYEQSSETVGMVSIVPAIIEAAQIEPSHFYAYIENLDDNVPVLTAYGKYMTEDGNMHSYADGETEFTQDVDMYLSYCYANMKNKDFMKNVTY